MWLVLYGRGRGLRVPGRGGGTSMVARFENEMSAKAFVGKCLKRGLRATEPRRLGAR